VGLVRFVRLILLAVVLGACGQVALARQDAKGLGPEMTAYVGFIEAEQEELKHLFEAGEVPSDEYRLERNRLAARLEAALRVARGRGTDAVPDLYVLRADEITQVLPDGVVALKGKRSGDAIDDAWTYHGTIRKGDLFYILERRDKLVDPTIAH
jgi:hypothetical protein